jgi:hypothetical protein
MIESEIKHLGEIHIIQTNLDGTKLEKKVKNKVLYTGRSALAASLANSFGGSYNFFISNVLFGSNGTIGGVPRFIDDGRDGLFGPTILSKPVLATINPDFTTQVTFTTVVAFDEVVGQVINEMALQMADSSVFSMATFGDINKTNTMQLTWNWKLSMV